MSFSMFRRFSLAGFGLPLAALVLLDASARAQEAREIIIQRVLVDDKADKAEEKKDAADDDDDERPAYWIGIALAGEEGQKGLTVADVLPDSPALQAGLQAGDLLAAVGEKKLERQEQLIDLIQDSGGKPLELHVVREGKEVTVRVKPGKRPTESPRQSEAKQTPVAPTPVPVAPPVVWTPDPQRPDATRPDPQRPDAQPRTARMAVAFPSPQLPEDMEVTISKKGNKPAVVAARQGDKLWKTTENELGMLPPPAQAYAAKMLGKDVRARMPGGGPPGMMPGMGGMMMPGMPAMGMPGLPETGGIQVEIRNREAKRAASQVETRREHPPTREAAREEVERARRIRDLKDEAERLRAQLNNLREEAKE